MVIGTKNFIRRVVTAAQKPEPTPQGLLHFLPTIYVTYCASGATASIVPSRPPVVVQQRTHLPTELKRISMEGLDPSCWPDKKLMVALEAAPHGVQTSFVKVRTLITFAQVNSSTLNWLNTSRLGRSRTSTNPRKPQVGARFLFYVIHIVYLADVLCGQFGELAQAISYANGMCSTCLVTYA